MSWNCILGVTYGAQPSRIAVAPSPPAAHTDQGEAGSAGLLPMQRELLGG
ncbi:MAG: hypothetical protein ACHBNF_05875 [Chromatiales bacterium]